jgi:serine/threonine protein phosphatase PrpC
MAEAESDRTMRLPSSLDQMAVEIAALTDVGRMRDHNEDNLLVFQPDNAEELYRKGVLCAVADGMGGHASGEVASRIAIETLLESFRQNQSNHIAQTLLDAYGKANQAIYEQSNHETMRSRMGTTLVSALLHNDERIVANVGDSRAYLIEDGFIRQITQDHSWVAEQVRRGELSQAEAEQHPMRNLVTRSLGVAAQAQVDVFREALHAGDTVLLCSDGLSGVVTAPEMLEVATKNVPEVAVRRLVDLANERGGPDNITVVIMRLNPRPS